MGFATIFDKLFGSFNLDNQTYKQAKIVNGNLILVASDGAEINVTVKLNMADVIPYTSTASNEEVKKYKKGAVLTRETLVEPITQSYEKTPYDSIVKKVAEAIGASRPKDVGSLRGAAMICIKEDGGAGESDIEAYRVSLSKLFRIPGEAGRGHTLYNWLRCGEVFDQEVFPHLEICKRLSEHGNFQDLFLPWWEARLKFHPTKVFVHRYQYENELFFELKKRLIDNDELEIAVYSRKSRRKIADSVIKKLCKEYPNVQIKGEERYRLGGSEAKTTRLIKEKQDARF